MPFSGRRLLVLGWHNIEGTPCFPSARGEGLGGFRDQLDWLGRRTNVVPLRDALRRLRSGAALPPRATAITFDDGYRDNLELAVPELERRGMPATFFLVPGLLDRRVEPWWEQAAWAVTDAIEHEATIDGRRLVLADPGGRRAVLKEVAELLKRRDRAAREGALQELIAQLAPRPRGDLSELFLDWEGARALASRGFEIGSHSRDHAILSEETARAQAEDLATSRSALESGLGVPVTAVAYPNGTRHDYDAATLAAARAAGFETGVTTRKGINSERTPHLEARRVVVYPERGSRIVRTLAQVAWTRGRRAAARLQPLPLTDGPGGPRRYDGPHR
jgi:peptidoglycan/xylan/chitin deacetylase (PgdA/CDA1 family)